MILRSPISYLQCLTFAFAASSALVRAESPIFSVQLGTKTILLEGQIDSEGTAQSLAAALKGARPDLDINTGGLVVDPSTSLPNIADIRSLLEELGLSTHEGLFEIWPDRVLVGGLTDSLVTLTALKIRLEPILKGRRLINHICIVSSEDLPKIGVLLSENNPATGQIIVGKLPTVEQPFEVPGLLLEKLIPTLLMLNDFDRIEGKVTTPPAPLRAMPAEMTVSGVETGPAGAPPLLPVIPVATPVQQYETLPSVRFATNSFLLQANQLPIFDELAKFLLAPERKGRLIILEPLKPRGGSAAFNDYLSGRRGEEVKRLLVERGVDGATLTAKEVDSLSPVDEGEVRLRIEVPLLPATPAESPTAVPSAVP